MLSIEPIARVVVNAARTSAAPSVFDTGLLLIKAYHLANGDTQRTKIIVPDSAHGTNPASAVMAGR